jgi:hypothetical protein
LIEKAAFKALFEPIVSAFKFAAFKFVGFLVSHLLLSPFHLCTSLQCN